MGFLSQYLQGKKKKTPKKNRKEKKRGKKEKTTQGCARETNNKYAQERSAS
jgi:hypothetical protein